MCKPSRRFLLVVSLLAAGCGGVAQITGATTMSAAEQRFKGIRGLVLVVDALGASEMKQVVFVDDRGVMFYASSTVARRNREIMSLGMSRVPVTATVTWGKDGKYDFGRATWSDRTLLGNYTIPIAERIPDEVLDDIRKHGGGLRLKFRLKTDGVMFGWDIERADGGTSRFDMPGGDFLDTRY
jgi:hypothetical protein